MSRERALEPLTDLLVDLYPTEEGSRRVVAEAGLHHGRIAFQEAALDNWFAILSEADRRRSVDAVVAVAQEEYPESSGQLQAALESYASSPEAQSQEVLPDLQTGPRRLNLAMLMVITLVLTLWFYLHLYPLVERSLAVGALGTGLAAGLLAAWKLITAFLGRDWSQKGRSRFDRLLRSAKTSWVLGFSTLFALGLALSTSSVYLIHDDETIEDLVVSIQKRSDTAALSPFAPLPRLHTRPAVAPDGGPIYFRRPGETLVFKVESSPILSVEPNERRLWPWKGVVLHAAVDFKSRPIRVFRLAPGNQIMGRLMEPGDFVPFKKYSLEVLWDGEPVGRLDDLRQGVVYFGDEPELMEALRREESAEQRRRELGNCVGSELLDELMEYWDSGFQVLEARRPPTAQKLEVRIFESSMDTGIQAGVVRFEVEIPSEENSIPGLHTICLRGARS